MLIESQKKLVFRKIGYIDKISTLRIEEEEKLEMSRYKFTIRED